MKVIVVEQPGGPEVLKMQERPVPSPGLDEILIKVSAAGVNRPDVYQRKGNYPPPAWAPQDVPGLEVAGVVVACGEGVVKWSNGDRVCALLAGGGYAEYALAHADHCLPIPSGLTDTEAAALPETVFTVWHNVFQRGALSEGQTLLVHGGASGIGTTAIQLAKAFGAKVFVTVGTPEKYEACIALGADRCINYQMLDFEAELQDVGVDVILDMIGGDYVNKNIRLLRPDGKLVFINTMKGSEVDSVDFSAIMQRRLTITGSTLRNRSQQFKAALAAEIFQKVWPVMNAGKFKPVIYQQFRLDQAVDAHRALELGGHVGKFVLLNNH
jgi:NADPH:quinone reductase